jgi:hypothetical protein
MRKQSWIINVVLIALAVVLGMKLRADWQRTNARQNAADAVDKPPAAPAASTLNAAPAAVPGTELIAQNNLFSADRNNVQPQSTQEVKPQPPDPLLLGSMNVGSGPIALMLDGAAQPNTVAPHSVRIGEMIGAYKLTKVGDGYAMVEYEGVEKRIEAQASPHQDNRLAPPQSAGQRVAPPPPPVTNVKTASPTSNTKVSVLPDKGTSSTGNPNTRSSFDMFGPGVQDNYPTGTNLEGWVKVSVPWPMGGTRSWWEKAPKQ